jgi:hypothetical protein
MSRSYTPPHRGRRKYGTARPLIAAAAVVVVRRRPVPDFGAEQQQSRGLHQGPQGPERLGDGAEGLVGAAADDDIGRAGMVRRLALDKGDPAGQAPCLGVLPGASEVRPVDVDTRSGCLRRGFQHPQQELAPSAAVVNDVRRLILQPHFVMIASAGAARRTPDDLLA